MASNLIFSAIVLLIGFRFILENWLLWLNYKNLDKNIPQTLADVYAPERYKQFLAYEKAGTKMALVESVFSTMAILGVLFLGGFGWLDTFLREYFTNLLILTVLFFGIAGFASDIAGIPFEWYNVFVIEKKFGFTTMNWKTFVADKLKSWVLAAVLGGAVLALICWLFLVFKSWFWIFALAVVVLVGVLINFFYSTVIVPLFNKQVPLGDGDLRDALTAFFHRINFNFRQIFIIDGSKRSLKANAYFSGFGRNRRVVIYDTLQNILTVPELVAVLAHEIGHYKKRHIYFSMVFGAIQAGLLLYVFSLVADIPEFSIALGGEPSFYMALLIFSFLYGPISLVLGVIFNFFSRQFEYQADAFAARNGQAEFLQSALKKLTASNLSNLNPHPWYVFFNHSHPPLFQRMARLQTIAGEKE